MGSSASTANRKKLSAAEITESLDAVKAKITELADDQERPLAFFDQADE